MMSSAILPALTRTLPPIAGGLNSWFICLASHISHDGGGLFHWSCVRTISIRWAHSGHMNVLLIMTLRLHLDVGSLKRLYDELLLGFQLVDPLFGLRRAQE